MSSMTLSEGNNTKTKLKKLSQHFSKSENISQMISSTLSTIIGATVDIIKVINLRVLEIDDWKQRKDTLK